jgi:hypothetical protein
MPEPQARSAMTIFPSAMVAVVPQGLRSCQRDMSLDIAGRARHTYGALRPAARGVPARRAPSQKRGGSER